MREFFEAYFAAGYLGRDNQAILERDAVSVICFGEQFGDLVSEEFHLHSGLVAADCSVFASVGKDFLILNTEHSLIGQRIFKHERTHFRQD